MDPARLEACFLREPAQDEEGARSRQPSALRIQEELWAMAPVEKRAASAEIAAERVGGAATEGNDPLLPALADRAHEPFLEVDASALEADRLTHAEPRAVEELDKSAVAEIPRRRARGCLDQAFCFSGRKRARQAASSSGKRDVGGRALARRSDQHAMAEERAHRGEPPGDRRGGEALGAQVGEVALELLPRGSSR